ncbi:hypothetical protein [Leifsonia aquatica]|uniref:hypothetical protein n=1 Tax=Leifsonia aquatica TaxID=144185 RepID=UPI0038308F08
MEQRHGDGADIPTHFHYAAIDGVRGGHEFILDNNVLSIVEGMLRTSHGRHDERRDKVEDFVSRLNADPGRVVSDDFALLEATQFASAEGLRADTLVIRQAALRVLQDAPLGIYDAAAALEAFGFSAGWDQDVKDDLRLAIDRLPLSFAPAYTVALLLEHRLGEGAHAEISKEDALAALQLLADRFDFVPGTLWMTLLLACCGNRDARASAIGVLKTGRKDRKRKSYLPLKNAQSAAWDLASLQSLSERIPERARATLVTEDKALATLVGHLNLTAGGLQIREEHFDGKRISLRDELLRSYAELRQPRMGLYAAPSLDLCAAIIDDVESRLQERSGVARQIRQGPIFRLPDMSFVSGDLGRVRDLLLEFKPFQLSELRLPFEGGSADRQRSAFNALVRLTAAAAQVVGHLRGCGARSVIEELRFELDTNEWQYAFAVLDYLERTERPVQAAARYAFMTYDQAVAVHFKGLAVTSVKLLRSWTAVLGHSSGDLVLNEAARVVSTEAASE